MKEYTAQEMKNNPVCGWFWVRNVEETVYADTPVGIRWFFDGLGCTFTVPFYKIKLKNISDELIFYGPVEKPEVPEC